MVRLTDFLCSSVKSMERIVIIGNGISGITTARHVRKRNSQAEIVVISSETKYFFSRTALMYAFMGHMKKEHMKPYEDNFWAKNRIELCFAHVNSIDFSNQKLHFANGKQTNYSKLILALGSKPNKFGWPGQDLKGVQGLYSYNDLELMEENTKHLRKAVIVGGGLIGVEMAEMLRSRNIEVDFLVRENRFWGNVLPKEEGDLVRRHIEDHGVNLIFETNLLEILADENGRVRAVKTDTQGEIECQFVGLTAGVSPNIEFLKETQLETDRGIVVNEFLETNQPNVYAIGDCAQFKVAPKGRRNIEQVWYTGRMMGEVLAKTIIGEKTAYKPGNWFNSAKFFDIEYQTYGVVSAQIEVENEHFYWEHKDGKIGVKFVFNKASEQFLGINTFGIRMRHELFDNWLTQSKSIDFVMEHLEDANFDPELYKQYGSEIVSAYNQQFEKKIQLKKKKWARIFS